MADNKIYPVNPKTPGIYETSELFDAANPKDNSVLPKRNSIVFFSDNTMYRVIDSNTTTLTYTLSPIVNVTEDDLRGRHSLISYENDYFCIYIDKRSKPYRVTIAARMAAIGDSIGYYKLKLNPYVPGGSSYISKYYSSTGSFVSESVPMTKISDDINVWAFNSCFIHEDLEDNVTVALEVFNEYGAQVDTFYPRTKKSIISNDSLDYMPKIIQASVVCSQMMPDRKTVYLLEKQAFTSLNLSVKLTYEDGLSQEVEVDDVRTFLYGRTDFIASFSGQKQNMIIKYFLSENEVDGTDGGNITNRFINVPFQVLVRNNEILDIVKLSVIPVWNNVKHEWVLFYKLYGVHNNFYANVTPFVHIASGTYVPNDFTQGQSFVVTLDLHDVAETHYEKSTNYIQNVYIRLAPNSAGVKYILANSKDSTIVYGQDSTNDRRPMLCYDKTKNIFFIPSSVFKNTEALLKSFYYNATPPYDTTIQSSETKPTHFMIRDVYTDKMLTNYFIDIEDYQNSIALTDGNTSVGNTIIIEFAVKLGDTYQILYGVPVDIVTGTY